MFGYWLGWFLVISSAILTVRNFIYLLRLNEEFKDYLRKAHPDYWDDADVNIFRMFPVGRRSIPNFLFMDEDLGDPLLKRKKQGVKQQILFTFLYMLGTGLMVFFVGHFYWR